jgi:hypothetical protein
MHGGENDLGVEGQFQHERNPKRVLKELIIVVLDSLMGCDLGNICGKAER